MNDRFAARESLTLALEDAAELLREHGQQEWDADFLYQQRLGHAWVSLERLAG